MCLNLWGADSLILPLDHMKTEEKVEWDGSTLSRQPLSRQPWSRWVRTPFQHGPATPALLCKYLKKKTNKKKNNTNIYHLRQFYICTPVVQFEKLDVAMEVSQSQQLLTLEDSHDAIAWELRVVVYLCPLTAQSSTICNCCIQKPKVEREFSIVTSMLPILTQFLFSKGPDILLKDWPTFWLTYTKAFLFMKEPTRKPPGIHLYW